jgi:hypothetical protein
VNTLPWILVAVLVGVVGWLLLALSGASRTIADLRGGSRWPPGRDDGIVHVSAGLAPGTPAPAFEGTGLDRTVVRSSDLTGSRHLLVFVDPDCAACDVLVPELIGASDRREAPPTVFVSRGAPEDHSPGWVGGNRSSTLVEADDAISAAYAVDVTPTAFVVDEGGAIVASGAFATLDDLLVMVAETDGVRVVPSTEASS